MLSLTSTRNETQRVSQLGTFEVSREIMLSIERCVSDNVWEV